jgi:hypothetical protein
MVKSGLVGMPLLLIWQGASTECVEKNQMVKSGAMQRQVRRQRTKAERSRRKQKD